MGNAYKRSLLSLFHIELLFETKMICKKKDCPKWRRIRNVNDVWRKLILNSFIWSSFLFFPVPISVFNKGFYLQLSQMLLMNSLCNYYSQIEVWLIYKIMFDNSRTKQMHRTWRDTENILKFKPIIKFLHNRGHSECCSFL